MTNSLSGFKLGFWAIVKCNVMWLVKEQISLGWNCVLWRIVFDIDQLTTLSKCVQSFVSLQEATRVFEGNQIVRWMEGLNVCI